jgi:predicted aldo/keto reductase-like oxidoreductase
MMEYRKLGRTGLDVGIIGLGTEHLQPGPEVLDQVLGTAVEAGVNYVDLIYILPDYWETYGPVFRAYRDKMVATAHWGNGQSYELDFCRQNFEVVLNGLGNGYAEVGMMTMVDSPEQWNDFAQRSLEKLRDYQKQGRVGWIGMSGHTISVAQQAVESGLLDVLMVPLNVVGYGDEKEEALRQACSKYNVGLVAMKAYHGGRLFWVDDRPSGITPAHCLSYLFSLPVATAVPGPKNVDELRATLHFLEATEEEKDYRPVATGLPTFMAGQCVYCHHCLPCPVDIPVGWMMWLLDQVSGRTSEEVRGLYASFNSKVSSCVECGECLARCPFGVDIMGRLDKVAELFEETKDRKQETTE